MQESEVRAAVDRREVEDFLYREARLQDEGCYDEWEALWADDAHYWVPANGDDIDPSRQISIINDNRRRIHTRVEQLRTGERHTQVPPSRTRRVISNVEIESAAGDEMVTGSNFILVESRSGRLTTWAGRIQHTLRRENRGFALVRKKVMLVNNGDALPTLSFLI